MQFLQYVERNFPKDRDMLRNVSIIEESQPKMVRMAFLAVIGSHKVNGVAELHSDLIKTTIFKDFVKIYGPDKFTNVTNGITPRRWLHQANPRLSELIASKLGDDEYLKDLTHLNKLEAYVDDKSFRKEFQEIKYANKVRLAKFIKENNGVSVNPAALFDIQVKRIHEYKRQQLNIFGVIHRYLTLKAMSPEERKKVTPRVSIFGGKAAPGYWMAKTVSKTLPSSCMTNVNTGHPPRQPGWQDRQLGQGHWRSPQGHLFGGLQRQQGRDHYASKRHQRAHLNCWH